MQCQHCLLMCHAAVTKTQKIEEWGELGKSQGKMTCFGPFGAHNCWCM